jgi:hypothetical protein
LARNSVALWLLLFALPAAAQKPRIAVLPFNGPQGIRAQGEAVRALRGRAEIVPLEEWDAAAKKLFATSRSAEDIAAVANDLNVKVVITGAIKRDGGWVLVVTARHGPTGKSAEKLKYPLRGPRLDPPVLKRMSDEIGAAVDKAEAGPPPDTGAPDTGAPDTGEGGGGAPPPEDNENPLAKKEPASAPPPEGEIERPEWTPFVDASIGLLLSGRKLGFSESGLASFNSTVAPGLRIDATAYPLALLARRPGALINALTGLGVGATFDYVFYPDAKPAENMQDMKTCGGPPPCQFPTTELRLEAGLRWHWNILRDPLKPELLVNFQFGHHQFAISKRADGTSIVPNVAYSYLDFGVGARWMFLKMFGAALLLDLLVPFSTGEIHTMAEYGPGSAIGFRPTLALLARPWRGLTARLGAFLEYYSLSFSDPTMATHMTTGSASDLYWGLLVSAGYVF